MLPQSAGRRIGRGNRSRKKVKDGVKGAGIKYYITSLVTVGYPIHYAGKTLLKKWGSGGSSFGRVPHNILTHSWGREIAFSAYSVDSFHSGYSVVAAIG